MKVKFETEPLSPELVNFAEATAELQKAANDYTELWNKNKQKILKAFYDVTDRHFNSPVITVKVVQGNASSRWIYAAQDDPEPIKLSSYARRNYTTDKLLHVRTEEERLLILIDQLAVEFFYSLDDRLDSEELLLWPNRLLSAVLYEVVEQAFGGHITELLEQLEVGKELESDRPFTFPSPIRPWRGALFTDFAEAWQWMKVMTSEERVQYLKEALSPQRLKAQKLHISKKPHKIPQLTFKPKNSTPELIVATDRWKKIWQENKEVIMQAFLDITGLEFQQKTTNVIVQNEEDFDKIEEGILSKDINVPAQLYSTRIKKLTLLMSILSEHLIDYDHNDLLATVIPGGNTRSFNQHEKELTYRYAYLFFYDVIRYGFGDEAANMLAESYNRSAKQWSKDAWVKSWKSVMAMTFKERQKELKAFIARGQKNSK